MYSKFVNFENNSIMTYGWGLEEPIRIALSVAKTDLLKSLELQGKTVVNISQIKHTWFSFVFLFVTDLSNYNAVIFTGKRHARMEGIRAF